MSYVITAISNKTGENQTLSPEQAYRKLQNAGACAQKPFAGTFILHTKLLSYLRRIGSPDRQMFMNLAF